MSTSMLATGMVYLGKTKPLATNAADGTFNLTLLALDRQGLHQVEGWRITWAGPEAKAWHAQHGDQLPAGTALRITCTRIRSHSLGRFGRPEIHALVAQCALVAPTQPDRADTGQDTNRKTLCTS